MARCRFAVRDRALAILIGLGAWQLDAQGLERKSDRHAQAGCLAAPDKSAPARALAALREAGEERIPPRRFPAEFLDRRGALVYTAGSALRPDVTGPGYWVFALPDRGRRASFVVNRGFVPEQRARILARAQRPGLRGIIEMVGVLRWPEARGPFTPADDPPAISGSCAIRMAMAPPRAGARSPLSISTRRPAATGGLPRVGALKVDLRNDICNIRHYVVRPRGGWCR